MVWWPMAQYVLELSRVAYHQMYPSLAPLLSLGSVSSHLHNNTTYLPLKLCPYLQSTSLVV